MEDVPDVPQDYLCPISQQIMKDPVIAGDGITYQRKFIQQWFTRNNTSAFTGKRLPHKTLIPNYALKNTIQNFEKNMPNIMKQKQIKIDLHYAIKMKEQQMKDFINKIQKKKQFSNKEEQNLLIKNKQLERQLGIQRKSHQITQKQLQQWKDKCVAYQFHIEDLNRQIQNLKKKQCKCKNEKNFKEQKVLKANVLFSEKVKNQQIKRDLMSVQQILKKFKKISLKPTAHSYAFKSGYSKFAQNRRVIGSGVLFSDQTLPISQQSFYFTIIIKKMDYLKRKKEDGQFLIDMGIGISFPADMQTNKGQQWHMIGYWSQEQNFRRFSHNFLPIKQDFQKIKENSYKLPLIFTVLINQKDKTIYLIWNNKVQIKYPLQMQFLNQKYPCRAYIYTSYGYQSVIQFT